MVVEPFSIVPAVVVELFVVWFEQPLLKLYLLLLVPEQPPVLL